MCKEPLGKGWLTKRTVTWGLMLSAFLLGLIYFVPKNQVGFEPIGEKEKNLVDAENSSRDVLVKTIGGLLLFGTAGISYLGYLENKKNVSLAETKQVTEKFITATNMISNDSLYTCLAGFYTLQELAIENRQYFEVVVELLSAFIREASPRSESEDVKTPLSILDFFESLKQGEVEEPENISISRVAKELALAEMQIKTGELIAAARCPLKVRVAIDVLCHVRSTYARRPLETGGIPCQATDLSRADLRQTIQLGVELSCTNFSYSNLQKAVLTEATLDYSLFYLTNLRDANLSECFLNGCKFVGADLAGASLRGAILYGADFSESNVTLAQLKEAYGDETTVLPEGIPVPKSWKQPRQA